MRNRENLLRWRRVWQAKNRERILILKKQTPSYKKRNPGKIFKRCAQCEKKFLGLARKQKYCCEKCQKRAHHILENRRTTEERIEYNRRRREYWNRDPEIKRARLLRAKEWRREHPENRRCTLHRYAINHPFNISESDAGLIGLDFTELKRLKDAQAQLKKSIRQFGGGR